MIGIVKDVYREFEDGEWVITGTGCSLGKITVREIESGQIINALISSKIIRKNKIVSVDIYPTISGVEAEISDRKGEPFIIIKFKEETWNS